MDIQLRPGAAYGYTTCFTIRPHANCSEDNSINMPTTKLWNRLKPDQSDMIFGELNAWLATLSEDTQREMFYQYMVIHSALSSGKSRTEIDEIMEGAIIEIHNLIDFEHLDHWVRNCCEVAIQKDMEREYSGTFGRSTTYIVDEYYDLVTLHFYFKILAPIWPAYLNRYQTDESSFKEMHAYRLLEGSVVHELPAMDRLKQYAQGMVESQGSRFTPTIVKSLSSEEIPVYFMSRLITRLLSVGHVNDPDAPLHVAMFRHLSSLNKSLQAKLRAKSTANVNGQEDDSIADSVRIAEDIGDEHVIVDEVYLRSPLVLAGYSEAELETYKSISGSTIPPILRDLAIRDYLGSEEYDKYVDGPKTDHLDPDDENYESEIKSIVGEFDRTYQHVTEEAYGPLALDTAEVVAITNMLHTSVSFDVAAHHHIIMGVVLHDMLEIRNLPLIQNLEAIHCGIALTAKWLMQSGYEGLGAALISETVPAHKINKTNKLYDGVNLRALDKTLSERLDGLYAHVQLTTQGQPIRTGGSYGEILINHAVNSMLEQPFTNSETIPSTVRDDLAELLLKFN